MCGLVGMAGDLYAKHRDVMKDLIFFNTLRGRDSTGISAYNKTRNEITTRKLTVPGYEFASMAFIDELLKPCIGFWLGHGRARTVGQVSRLNAHPFEVREEDDTISLLGAHNGTLHNKYDIEKALGGGQFGTDSEALINLIAKVGIQKAIAEARGAWALTWWDSDNGSINMLRNDQRPLAYAYTEDRKVLLWASEPWMIRIACERNGVKLQSSKEGVPSLFMLNEDTHLCWEIPDFKYNGPEEQRKFAAPERKGGLLGKPEEKKFLNQFWENYSGRGSDPETRAAEAHARAWHNHLNGVDSGDDALDDDVPFEEAASKTKKEAQTGGKKTREADGGDKVVGFEGKLEDRAYVEELKKAGCDWCGEPVKSPTFAWLDEHSLCCSKCLSGNHVIVNTQKQQIISLHSVVGGRK